MVMASVENFLETLQKKFYLQNITIRRNFNSILRDLLSNSPIALYRRLGRSLFFGRRLVDSYESMQWISPKHNRVDETV